MNDADAQSGLCPCSGEPSEALRCCGMRLRVRSDLAEARADAHFVSYRMETAVLDSGSRDRTYCSFVASSYL